MKPAWPLSLNKEAIANLSFIIFSLAIVLTTANLAQAGTTEWRTLKTSDGRERSYVVHLPPSYKNQGILPAVLVFHGGGRSVEMTEEESRFSELANREGFIVVYPEGWYAGPNVGWNAYDTSEEWNLSAKFNINDLEFAEKLLEKLVQDFPIDQNRIYATGFSNGAQFVSILGCRLAGKITGIAPVFGRSHIQDCPLSRPLPVITFHEFSVDTAQENLGGEFWAKKNGCRIDSKEQTVFDRSLDGTTIIKTSYLDCRDQVSVVSYDIAGGSHKWPGMSHMLGTSGILIPGDVPASKLIWEFFRAHPKTTTGE